MEPLREPAPADDVPAAPTTGAGPQRIRSEDLLHGRQQIEIEHDGELYRLRLTRSGKLILTK